MPLRAPRHNRSRTPHQARCKCHRRPTPQCNRQRCRTRHRRPCRWRNRRRTRQGRQGGCLRNRKPPSGCPDRRIHHTRPRIDKCRCRCWQRRRSCKLPRRCNPTPCLRTSRRRTPLPGRSWPQTRRCNHKPHSRSCRWDQTCPSLQRGKTQSRCCRRPTWGRSGC